MRYYDEYKGLYYLQNYQIAKSWTRLPLMIAKHTISDARYIRHLEMSKKEKIHWMLYSMSRNFSRYCGGYLGGKYDSYSSKKRSGSIIKFLNNINKGRRSNDCTGIL